MQPLPSRLSSAFCAAVSGPTRLRLPDLLHITDQTADDVLSGRYDHLLPAGGVPSRRTLVHPLAR